MSWLHPGKWLLYLALIAALILGVWRLDKWRQSIGYEKAVAEFRKQAHAIDVKREAVTPPIVAKEAAAQEKIRTIYKTITKEVPVYVKADDCPLSGGFRVFHDAAANGELPNPAAIPNAAAVPAQDAASTIASNYETCKETSQRLIGLQEWVSEQQKLK